MRTVNLVISSRETINRRFLRAFEGEPQGTTISFESPSLLFKVLTGKRWELLKLMTGAGPMTIREAARRLGRDVKAVHSDIHLLLNTGILQKTENGRIEFPFDAVHVDFIWKPPESSKERQTLSGCCGHKEGILRKDDQRGVAENLSFTDYQAKYVAYELTRRFPPDSAEKLTAALAL